MGNFVMYFQYTTKFTGPVGLRRNCFGFGNAEIICTSCCILVTYLFVERIVQTVVPHTQIPEIYPIKNPL